MNGQTQKDIDRVTDYIPEHEMKNSDRLGKAVSALTSSSTTTTTITTTTTHKEQTQTNNSKKVLIKREDVDSLVRNLEMTKHRAEQLLKSSNGNLKSAFTLAINDLRYY